MQRRFFIVMALLADTNCSSVTGSIKKTKKYPMHSAKLDGHLKRFAEVRQQFVNSHTDFSYGM